MTAPSPQQSLQLNLALDVGHLLAADGDAALLHQPPGLALGGAQAAGHQQASERRSAVLELGRRGRVVVGMLALSPPPPNRARAASWAFCGLLLAVDQLGQLVGQDLLGACSAGCPATVSISSICSRGRKVSIRMHLSTSASPTFRQYW